MMRNFTSFLLLSLIVPAAGFSQKELSGKVRRTGSNDLVPDATIRNRTLDRYNISDMGGNYRIAANQGDTLVVSSAGYLTDTLIVSADMLAHGYIIFLDARVVALPAVTIDEKSNYQKDSIQRHEDYAWLLDKKHPVKLWNEKRRGDAPGLSFSPLGYYSKTEKDKRTLKRRLKEEEIDYYIDTKWPKEKVAMLTKLTGDSLTQFMARYRPSYKFCRGASNMDMLLYINDKLVEFKKKKD